MCIRDRRKPERISLGRHCHVVPFINNECVLKINQWVQKEILLLSWNKSVFTIFGKEKEPWNHKFHGMIRWTYLAAHPITLRALFKEWPACSRMAKDAFLDNSVTLRHIPSHDNACWPISEGNWNKTTTWIKIITSYQNDLKWWEKELREKKLSSSPSLMI